MKKGIKGLALALSMSMLLTACGGGSKSNDKASTDNASNSTVTESNGSSEKATKEIKWDAKSLPVRGEGDPIEGGTLQYAIVADSPIKGIFDENLYQDNNDYYVIGLCNGGNLYDADESFRLVSSDRLEINWDDENNKVEFKLNPDLKWSDGEPVTSKDLEYSYYVVGSPDYTGIRYDGTEHGRIIGMEDYHAGKTDKIEGITTPDDQTMVIQFSKFTPATHWGSGLQPSLMPYHYLKDIPIGDLEESDEIRIKPLSAGPYYISNYVQGEKIELTANPYYYKGKPSIDTINMEVVPQSNILSAIKAHKYDMVSIVPSKSVEEFKQVPGYNMEGVGDFYYSYLGFELGHFDKEKGEVTVNPDAKMADVNLRKAMGYALDQEAVAKQFYQGNNQLAKSVVLPVFGEFYDPSIKGYTYDPDKANQLLDEAGYKDVDGDGMREDKDGKPLEIHLAMMEGGDTQEPLSQYYLQSWADVGLNVTLATGRLIEFNSFYDKLEAEDPEIDVFAAAWGVGTNPNPKETYGNSAAFNMSRYTSDKLQEAIDRISSMEANDKDFVNKAYKDFQNIVFDEVPAIPLQWRTNWQLVNKRVLNYDAGYGNGEHINNAGDWALSADAPLEE